MPLTDPVRSCGEFRTIFKVAIDNHELFVVISNFTKTPMNTADFLNTLRARPDLPLAFSSPAGAVPAGFHLTEVKRVSHETVDCGNVAHNWVENQFELWSPSATGADRKPMLAGKFLAIVAKVRRIIAIDDAVEARVFGRVTGGADQLHTIESVETGADSIQIHLAPVSALCKPRTGASASAAGCCENDAEPASYIPCGCSSRKSPPSDLDVLGLRSNKDTWFTPFESQGFRMMF